MPKLLIYDRRKRAFSGDTIRDGISSIDPQAVIRQSPDVVAALETHLVFDGETVLVRLISTMKMLSIEGEFPAIAKAIVEFGSRLQIPLNVIDQEYTFDIPVIDTTTATSLVKQIDQGN